MFSNTLIQGLRQKKLPTKLKAGGYYIPVKLTVESDRILFNFGYNAELIDVIKRSFEGRKYHGFVEGDGRKLWSVPITFRNLFRLEVLRGKYAEINPYSYWEKSTDFRAEITQYCEARGIKPYTHQIDMVSEALKYHWYIMAAEMGTGKTLAAILVSEMCGLYKEGNMIWVGPKSALVAAKTDFRKWRTQLDPAFITYDGLKKVVERWTPGSPAPRILILDESSRCKNPTAQRTIAAKHIADSMRMEHGLDGCMIIEMSGTPSPKTPADWWAQCEIACPGFLLENSVYTLRERLGHLVEEESVEGGGSYKKLKCWKDTDDKCRHCGEVKDHENHEEVTVETLIIKGGQQSFERHKFDPGINEVANLSKRLKGLVGVWLKKDCLDLPAKRYEIVELQPTQEILNIASTIVHTHTRAVDALIALRTLSDGFLYKTLPTERMELCPGCKGEGAVAEYYDEAEPGNLLTKEEIEGSFRYIFGAEDEDGFTEVIGTRPIKLETKFTECRTCSGKRMIPIMQRVIEEITCPKLDLLDTLLEEHEEQGRLNVYAGFEGSIVRVVNQCHRKGWATLKADGRGWVFMHPTDGAIKMSPVDMVRNYQEGQYDFPRITFVGQPGAAGMGLTLTASPTTFYYSNDFNPEARLQSEDRGHRIGMDLIRGGRIIDCVHLPSDRKVIDSLKKSKKLQLLSMSGLRSLYTQGASNAS